MASNLTFGLVAISVVNEILILLVQTIVLFSPYPIIFGPVRKHFECKALLLGILFGCYTK